MRFVSYRFANQASYGLLIAGGIVDLQRRIPAAATLKDLIAGELLPDAARFTNEKPDVALDAVTLLPLIADPGQIFCVGLNYEDHRLETARPKASQPAIFYRCAESLQAHDQPLLIPRESDQFDYEGELALIIGRSGRRIAEADAWQHVAGVSCFNDASVRDFQYHTAQFGPGKNFPLTGSLGPALVTLDELPADRSMQLTTRLNGTVMQQASTSDMIFPVPHIIAYLSTYTTLQPGDVIVTGTPGGVGAKRKPPVWMRDGDVVEVDIEHVGLLRNRCVKES